MKKLYKVIFEIDQNRSFIVEAETERQAIISARELVDKEPVDWYLLEVEEVE
jgi:hypothetical protein